VKFGLAGSQGVRSGAEPLHDVVSARVATTPSPALERVRLSWLLPFLFALVVAAVYHDGVGMGFHFDDEHVIERNPAIRSLTNVPRFFVDPATSSSSHLNRVLRPLLLTTFALNYAISGGAPWSYHL